MFAWNRIDEFSENFETASYGKSYPTPHPIFGKLCCAFCNEIFRGAATPPFFFTEKAQRNFSDRKWLPPPPLEVFQKFIVRGISGAYLRHHQDIWWHVCFSLKTSAVPHASLMLFFFRCRSLFQRSWCSVKGRVVWSQGWNSNFGQGKDFNKSSKLGF